MFIKLDRIPCPSDLLSLLGYTGEQQQLCLYIRHEQWEFSDGKMSGNQLIDPYCLNFVLNHPLIKAKITAIRMSSLSYELAINSNQLDPDGALLIDAKHHTWYFGQYNDVQSYVSDNACSHGHSNNLTELETKRLEKTDMVTADTMEQLKHDFFENMNAARGNLKPINERLDELKSMLESIIEADHSK